MRSKTRRIHRGLAIEELEPRIAPATFWVTNTGDSGAGSLRQAVIDANAAGGADDIQFNAGLSGQTITLTSGELAITDDLTVTGLGAANLAVSGNDASRILNVDDGTGGQIVVSISGLTLTEGAFAGGVGSYGGGIRNREDLTLADCTVSSCRAESTIPLASASTFGGAIESGGVLDLTGCTFSGNSILGNLGPTSGGAVFVRSGTLTATNCTFSGNSTASVAGGHMGGAIGNRGQAFLDNCTLSGNSSQYGAGIHNIGTLTVSACTISGNSAADGGGGIRNLGTLIAQSGSVIGGAGAGNTAGWGGGIANEGTATIDASTVSANTATNNGGGIYNDGGTATVHAGTLSGNIAGGNGSGIYLNNGTLTARVGTSVGGMTYANGGTANLGDSAADTTTFTAGLDLSGATTTNLTGNVDTSGPMTLPATGLTMTGTTLNGGTVLQINGSAGNDAYSLRSALNQLTINGDTAALTGFTDIRLYGGAGDDRITVQPSPTCPVLADGEAGTDTFTYLGAGTSPAGFPPDPNGTWMQAAFQDVTVANCEAGILGCVTLSAANPQYFFTDADGDRIGMFYGGPGEAAVTVADGSDIISVAFSGTSIGTTLVVLDLDPLGTPNTLTSGTVTSGPGEAIGMLQFCNPYGVTANTDVTIDGGLTTFMLQGNGNNVNLQVAGNLGNQYFYGAATNCNTTVVGNATYLYYGGPTTGDAVIGGSLGTLYAYNWGGDALAGNVIVGGSATAIQSYGNFTGSAVIGANLGTMHVFGNATGPVNVGGNSTVLYVTGLLDGAFTAGGRGGYIYACGGAGANGDVTAGDGLAYLYSGGASAGDVDVTGNTGILGFFGELTGNITVANGNLTTLMLQNAGGVAVNGSTIDVRDGNVGSVMASGHVQSALLEARRGTVGGILIYGNLTDSSIVAKRLTTVGVTGLITGATGDEIRALDDAISFRVYDATQNVLITITNDAYFGNVYAHIGAVGWAAGGVIGGPGLILYTNDSGRTWIQQGLGVVPADATMGDVAAVSEQIAWAVGGKGCILRTDDGGATWVPQVSPVATGLLKIAAVSPMVAWAVGTGGVIVHTIDGGATWVQQGLGDVPVVHYQGVYALDDRRVWVTGDTDSGYAVLLRSVDGGATWQRLGSPATVPDTYFLDVYVLPDGTGWTVGHGPNFLKTPDFGDTWSLQYGSMDSHQWMYDANSTCAVNDRTAWTATDNGVVYWTANGGITWNARRTGSAAYVMSVYALSADTLWAVGATFPTGGAIAHSTDGGQTWQQQTTPVNQGLWGVDFAG